MKKWIYLSALGLAGALVAGAAISVARDRAEGLAAPKVYLIGNSLTQAGSPKHLAGAEYGRVQWHIYCNRNLPFIRENPAGHCNDQSTPWPQALSTPQYDFLCVQPFLGSTAEDDAEIIAAWAASQPRAVLVIHTAWTVLAEFPAIYEAGDAEPPTYPSPAYFAALLDELRSRLPGRPIRTTNVHEMLYAVHRDAAAGRGPFRSLVDLGEDAIHLKKNVGRYLVHNAMRQALGQPRFADVTELDPEVRAYLDEQLAAHGWRPPAE